MSPKHTITEDPSTWPLEGTEVILESEMDGLPVWFQTQRHGEYAGVGFDYSKRITTFKAWAEVPA